MRRLLAVVAVLALFGALAGTASAGPIWASEVTRLVRGDPTIGNLPGYYGGTYPGAYPVPLTEAEAKAAVLGAPDTHFLSLPGRNDVPVGSGWPYAYVEVAFGADFLLTGNQLLTIEMGASLESAHLWVWNVDGGNVQFNITRSGSDTIVVDLSAYADLFPNPLYNRIGIGGLDLNGASEGFDLDAIGVDHTVPDPASTLLLFGIALTSLGAVRRRR